MDSLLNINHKIFYHRYYSYIIQHNNLRLMHTLLCILSCQIRAVVTLREYDTSMACIFMTKL